MTTPTLMKLLIGVAAVCAVLNLGAALVLCLFPKKTILSVSWRARTYRGTVPPRTALNTVGKVVHTVFVASGVAGITSVGLLGIVDLFGADVNCTIREIFTDRCLTTGSGL